VNPGNVFCKHRLVNGECLPYCFDFVAVTGHKVGQNSVSGSTLLVVFWCDV